MKWQTSHIRPILYPHRWYPCVFRKVFFFKYQSSKFLQRHFYQMRISNFDFCWIIWSDLWCLNIEWEKRRTRSLRTFDNQKRRYTTRHQEGRIKKQVAGNRREFGHHFDCNGNICYVRSQAWVARDKVGMLPIPVFQESDDIIWLQSNDNLYNMKTIIHLVRLLQIILRMN